MSPATVKNNRKAAKTRDGDQPTAAAKGRPTMPQSDGAPSPFTPIADYAFLSDCHDGRTRGARRHDRLAVRPAL